MLIAKRNPLFAARTLSLRGATYKYQVFVPGDWSVSRKWPVILFLHGAGERGSDGQRQTREGIGKAIQRDHARFPAIVVLPQCSKDNWWSAPGMEEFALAALDAATEEFSGDCRRTYLTGLSMGGYGAWDIAAKNPDRFAALVPICGGIVTPASLQNKYPELHKAAYADVPTSYAGIAAKIGKTPVWIFHGAKDTVVPPDNSRKMFTALQEVGGDVRYTEYPRVGHASWKKAYADPKLTAWLFSKSL
jgi:predicted peptidase